MAYNYYGTSNASFGWGEWFCSDVACENRVFQVGDSWYPYYYGTSIYEILFDTLSGIPTEGNTYYSESGCILQISSDDPVFILFNGIDSEDITGVGSYWGGDGTSCTYKADGAATYTPVLSGKSFSPSGVTFSAGKDYYDSIDVGPGKATDPTPEDDETGIALGLTTLQWEAPE